jgi:hypothetical protein
MTNESHFIKIPQSQWTQDGHDDDDDDDVVDDDDDDDDWHAACDQRRARTEELVKIHLAMLTVLLSAFTPTNAPPPVN